MPLRTSCLLLPIVLASSIIATIGVELVLNPNKSELTKKSGEAFVVTCRVSNPSVKLTSPLKWSYRKDESSTEDRNTTANGQSFDPYPSKATTKNLMISEPTVADTGVYRCSAEVDGEMIEKKIRIEIYDALKIVDVPPVQNPVQGVDAKIKCIVSATPMPTIAWFKYQHNAAGKGKFASLEDDPVRYNFEEENQILIIKEFEAAKDDGVYMCQMVVQGDVHTVNITVSGFVAPNITTSQNNVESFEGANVDLVCLPTGNPVPEITWFKNDLALTSSDRISFDNSGKLHLKRVSPVDNGRYQCEANNGAGNARADMELTVIPKPEIESIEDQVVLKDRSIQVPCVYNDHDDDSTVEWYSSTGAKVPMIDDAAGIQGNMFAMKTGAKTVSLNLSKASKLDDGKFKCLVTTRAGEAVKEFYLHVEQPPTIDEHSPLLVRTYNDTVELFCAVEAVPTASWKWLTPNAQIVHADKTNMDYYTIEKDSDGSSTSLRIKPMSEDVFGVYTCIAENVHGNASKSFEVVKIRIPEKPIIHIENTQPNKVEISIENYHEESRESRAKRPDFINFKFLVASEYDRLISNEFTWNDVEGVAEATYNKDSMYVVKGLQPKTVYKVGVSGRNEAGHSLWGTSESFTTKPAEIPMKPTFKTTNSTECDDSCVIEWNEPDNMGAPITEYKINYGATKLTESGEYDGVQHVLEDTTLPAALQNKITLLHLKSGTHYIVRVSAKNDVGQSVESDNLIVRTRTVKRDDILSSSGGVGIGAIIAIVVVLIFLLVLCIDVACYYVNACGLLMCFCVNCCGKTPPEVEAKVVAMEEGNYASDEKKPIKDVEYNEAKGEVNEETPMITSTDEITEKAEPEKAQPKKDTTV